MNFSAPRFRAPIAAAVSVLIGTLLVTTLSVPAQAAETHSLTVSLQTPAGTPLSGIEVYVIPVKDGQEVKGDRSPEGNWPVAKPVTGKPGVYKADGLQNFDHTLYFATATSTTFGQLLGGASEIMHAQVIPAGQTSIDATLATNAVFTGVAKSPAGNVFVGATVRAYKYYDGEWVAYSSAKTNSSGKYTLTDIDPGSYKLRFFSPAGTYPAVFAGGVRQAAESKPYSVAVGSRTVVNQTFPKYSGGISGVTKWSYDGYGSYPLEKARIIAYPVTVGIYGAAVTDYDAAIASGRSNRSGEWTISNLPAGKYVLRIAPYYYNQSAGFVGGSSHVDRASEARVFAVGSRVISGGTSKVNGTDRGGSLLLTAVSSNSQPIAAANVLLQRISDPDEFYRGTTDSSGRVRLGRVGTADIIQPGLFKLSVTAEGRYEPQEVEYVISRGMSSYQLALNTLSTSETFYEKPAIAELSTEVGTSYSVTSSARNAWATKTYQWYRDGRPIAGATADAYTSRTGDIGTQLAAYVTVSAPGQWPDTGKASVQGLVTASSAAAVNVIRPKLTPTSPAHVGSTLRVSSGKWSVDGMSFAYRWFRDGVEFNEGAQSYDLKLADLNSNFEVEVVASKDGYPPADPIRTEPVQVEFGGPTQPVGAVAVSKTTAGVPTGSTKYSVTAGKWSGLDPVFRYEWQRAGRVVGTGSIYVEKNAASYIAVPLEVVVSVSSSGFADGSVTKVARKGTTALTFTTPPAVSTGDSSTVVSASTVVTYGSSLLITPGSWKAVGDSNVGVVSPSYQWFKKSGTTSTAIKGATESTFAPGPAEVSSSLSVRVTLTSTRWGAVTRVVGAGRVVGDTALRLASPSVSIAGPPTPGERLVADLSNEWAAIAPTISFQWYGCAASTCTSASPRSSYSKIRGANSRGYVVGEELASGRVFLAATASKSGFSSAVVYSPIISITKATVIPIRKAPEIEATRSGHLRISDRLQVDTEGVFGRSPTSVVVQREVCMSDCQSSGSIWAPSTGTMVDGDFFLSAADYGFGSSYVRAKVVAKRSGYQTATAFSATVAIDRGKFTVGWRPSPRTTAGTWSAPTAWTIDDSELPRRPGATTTARWWVGDQQQSEGLSYEKQAIDAGKAIYLATTISAPAYEDFVAIDRVLNGSYNKTPSRPASIAGDSFDDVLSVDAADIWDLPQAPLADWKYSYSWTGMVDPYSAITNLQTYRPGPTDVGRKLAVHITAESPVFGFWSTYAALPSPLLPAPSYEFETNPVLSWKGDLGHKTVISATGGTFSTTGVTSRFEWQSRKESGEWLTIAGATTSSYVIGLTDAGSEIRVIVRGTKPGYSDAEYIPPTVSIPEGSPVKLLSSPSLRGDARVDVAVGLSPGAWTSGAVLTIQWLINGKAIPGAIGSSYVPLAIHAGDEISARVTASEAGKLSVVGETQSLTIAKATAPVATTVPVISGTSILSTTNGVWNKAGLTFTYQWFSDGEPIEGATSKTFTLPGEVERSSVSVTVSTVRSGYETGSASSATAVQ